MSEYIKYDNLQVPSEPFERERAKGILEICARFLEQDDVEFIATLDEEETINYLYGRLLNMGEDPDEILERFGVTESEEK